MIPMENCDHFFHKKCLNQYFKIEMEMNKIPLKCPITDCKHPVVYPIVIGKVLTTEQVDAYHHKTLSLCIETNKNLVWCPTPDCKGAVDWTPNNEKC